MIKENFHYLLLVILVIAIFSLLIGLPGVGIVLIILAVLVFLFFEFKDFWKSKTLLVEEQPTKRRTTSRKFRSPRS